MEPLEFKSKWQACIVRSGLPASEGLLATLPAADPRLSTPTATFLVEAGLPESAAPFLAFDDVAEGLRNIYEVSGGSCYWNEEDRKRLTPYLLISSDSAGNPICIDLAHEEQIVLLDHEIRFEAVQFVNSSVAQLAECLLAYSEMIETLQRELGKDAYLNGEAIPLELFQETWARFQAIDSRALDDDCFWQGELQQLRSQTS